MRKFVTALVALVASVPSQAGQTQTPAEEEWVSTVTIWRLDDTLANRPAEASLSRTHSSPWIMIDRPVQLPEPLRSRAGVRESFVLLDIGSNGEAGRCRPLRPSSEPALDAAGCDYLTKRPWFRAEIIPGRYSGPSPWVIGFRWRTERAADAKARQARMPMIAAPPPPRRPLRAVGLPREEPPSTGPRRALYGQLTATDYAGITDRRLTNPQFAAEMAVNEEGKPTGCRVTQSTGNAAIDARTCELLIERAGYTRRIDAEGRLISDTVPARVDVGWLVGAPPPR